MAKTSVSVRLDAELDRKLAAIAARLDRPRSWVMLHALEEFIETQLWQLDAIEQGLRDADAGRVAEHAEVVSWVRSWGQEEEQPMPGCE